jgi:hypothetical protein
MVAVNEAAEIRFSMDRAEVIGPVYTMLILIVEGYLMPVETVTGFRKANAAPREICSALPQRTS